MSTFSVRIFCRFSDLIQERKNYDLHGFDSRTCHLYRIIQN